MTSITQRLRRKTSFMASAAVILTVSLTVAGTGTSSASSNLTIGEIFPFTGAKAQLSGWGTHGTSAGIYEVNSHGGVMGHKLITAAVDDAADSVDALPALRKLLLKHPTAIVGPFSPTISAVIKVFGPSHVVDFMIGGITQLDQMKYPYVFRMTASDSTEAVAMAYYAAKIKGYRTASLIFDNSANSQGFVPPLMKAFKKLGGTIQQNLSIVPGQGSYRSELTKAFAGHPQVVFVSFDTQTASTLWADAGQLGYLDTPWVGDDLESSIVYAKAFGPKATTNLVSAVGTAPTGKAFAHFLADYKAVFKTDKPFPTTPNFYDAVVVGALAMTEAKSTNPKVWVKHVFDVASPPGIACSDYASCVKLLKAHKQIDYQGAGGDDNFNKYHNVFSGFSVVGFNADLSNTAGTYVSSAQIAASAN